MPEPEAQYSDAVRGSRVVLVWSESVVTVAMHKMLFLHSRFCGTGVLPPIFSTDILLPDFQSPPRPFPAPSSAPTKQVSGMPPIYLLFAHVGNRPCPWPRAPTRSKLSVSLDSGPTGGHCKGDADNGNRVPRAVPDHRWVLSKGSVLQLRLEHQLERTAKLSSSHKGHVLPVPVTQVTCSAPHLVCGVKHSGRACGFCTGTIYRVRILHLSLSLKNCKFPQALHYSLKNVRKVSDI